MDFGFGGYSGDDDSYDSEYSSSSTKKKKKKRKKKKMSTDQFLNMDVGSSLAGIDLSKIGKYALVSDKGFLGKKPKIVIFFHDRPDTPAVNFELQSDEEAQKIYKRLEKALNAWAEEANSSKVRRLEAEIEQHEKKTEALMEQNKVLMGVFDKFKEMMHIMEDETKTSELVATIKDM